MIRLVIVLATFATLFGAAKAVAHTFAIDYPEHHPGVGFVGHPHADLVDATFNRDVLSGRGGRDDLRGRRGVDAIFGGDAGDHLAGGPDDDLLKGGAGADVVDGGPGDGDTCYGGPGADYLFNCEGMPDFEPGVDILAGIGRRA